MTHNEKRSDFHIEFLAGLISGFLFGSTVTIVGHPFDTIKTIMQVQAEFKTKSIFYTAKKIYLRSGILGFYKGSISPLIGSSLYRSCQFAVYEGLYTKMSSSRTFSIEIPFMWGLTLKVLIPALIAGSIRAMIECPFEYIKVQGQIGSKWKVVNIFQGFKLLWFRSSILMTTYFSSVDICRRKTNLFNTNTGLFVMNGFCSVVAWVSIWPLEIVKNQVQSLDENNYKKNYKILSIIKENISKNGILAGLSRGSIPGLISVFLRSGSAMIVMKYSQRYLTKIGLRN